MQFTENERQKMTQINGIPVYEAKVDESGCGMTRVSLVDEPAVLTDFVAFDAEKVQQRYAVEDEEKRLVWGVLMRADFPIYRRDERLGEYYIVYTADTIRNMAQKYLKEGLADAVNVMHEEGSDVEGVEMVQLVIQDSERGIVPKGFDDIKDGSLFAEYHVTNDEVWEKIKSGEYRGFSIECTITMESADEETAKEAATSKEFTQTRYSIMKKLKETLMQMLKAVCKMGAISTSKGLLVWDGEGDLEVGTEVFVEDEQGERQPAANDEYPDEENNRVIVVVDGKVSEIRDVEPEQEQEAEQPAEQEQTSEQENAEEQPAENGLEERLAKLEKIVGQMADMFGIIVVEAKRKGAEPAAKPAHEAYRESKVEAEVERPSDIRCRKALSLRK